MPKQSVAETVKHTPGPWRAVPDENWDTWEVHPVMQDDGLTGGYRWFKESDAKLIAAAPDLLAACKEAYVALPMTKHNEPINEMLKAAIVKAEGQ